MKLQYSRKVRRVADTWILCLKSDVVYTYKLVTMKTDIDNEYFLPPLHFNFSKEDIA